MTNPTGIQRGFLPAAGDDDPEAQAHSSAARRPTAEAAVETYHSLETTGVRTARRASPSALRRP